jgi:hypothetical protein
MLHLPAGLLRLHEITFALFVQLNVLLLQLLELSGGLLAHLQFILVLVCLALGRDDFTGQSAGLFVRLLELGLEFADSDVELLVLAGEQLEFLAGGLEPMEFQLLGGKFVGEGLDALVADFAAILLPVVGLPQLLLEVADPGALLLELPAVVLAGLLQLGNLHIRGQQPGLIALPFALRFPQPHLCIQQLALQPVHLCLQDTLLFLEACHLFPLAVHARHLHLLLLKNPLQSRPLLLQRFHFVLQLFFRLVRREELRFQLL